EPSLARPAERARYHRSVFIGRHRVHPAGAHVLTIARAIFSVSRCVNADHQRKGPFVYFVSTFLAIAAIIIGLFAAYNLFHYVLYLLATHPKDARDIGHVLNEFEQRQLVEWAPKLVDFLKHDDENRTYDDVFGTYRSENDNYSTCVFPRTIFGHPYESDYALLKPKHGMRLLDLGCGSG